MSDKITVVMKRDDGDWVTMGTVDSLTNINAIDNLTRNPSPYESARKYDIMAVRLSPWGNSSKSYFRLTKGDGRVGDIQECPDHDPW